MNDRDLQRAIQSGAAQPAIPTWNGFGHCPECGSLLVVKSLELFAHVAPRPQRTCVLPCSWAPGGKRWGEAIDHTMDRTKAFAAEVLNLQTEELEENF